MGAIRKTFSKVVILTTLIMMAGIAGLWQGASHTYASAASIRKQVYLIAGSMW